MVNILMGIIDVINTQWVYIATHNMSTNIYHVREPNEYENNIRNNINI